MFGRARFGPHGLEHGNCIAELGSGDVVQFRYQGRLAHFAEMLAGRLRQGKPIVPVTEGILYALYPRDEPPGFGSLVAELRRTAGTLAQDTAPVQQSLGHLAFPTAYRV